MGPLGTNLPRNDVQTVTSVGDIVYNTDRSESGALIERSESRNGIHTLEHAEKIGFGSREYQLVSIDK